jgi:mRNA-degrading endonuclease RelE of RelBE toxin-antitoxin system
MSIRLSPDLSGARALVAYRLAHTEAALHDLQALPQEIFRPVDARILALAGNPRPRGTERIRGTRCGLRLRVGDYRILYRVMTHNRS